MTRSDENSESERASSKTSVKVAFSRSMWLKPLERASPGKARSSSASLHMRR
jgi:hypothetical protein